MEKREFNKILITGISGSGGSYLAEYIIENHPETKVCGTSRWHSTTSHKNLEAISENIEICECDLTDLSSITRVLNQVKPDAIFHLAAHANVRACFDSPLAILNNNIMGTANLFEAIRLSGIDPAIQLCSSSEVYGQVDPKNVPIKENCPLNPSSPYAVSKLTQDFLGHTYLDMKDYDSALKYYFKVEYLAPDNTKIHRPIAWFSFVIGRLETAQKYMQKVLDKTPSQHDFLMAGHIAWCSNMKKEAIEYYRDCIKAAKNDYSWFEKEFKEDAKYLKDFSITDLEISLLIDYLKP